MIKDWLHKPFPLIESLKDQIIIGLLAGVVVFLFLAVFQPFGISTEHEGIYSHLAGYGLITTVIVAFCFFLTSKLLPSSAYKDNWTIGKNIILIFIILILISILNFIYGQYIADQVYMQTIVQIVAPGILLWIFMTFTVGIFPVFFIIYFTERRLYKRNQQIAEEINAGMESKESRSPQVPVSIEFGKNKFLEISSSDLICMQAEGGNYSTIFWYDIEGVQKEMLRITLQNFMEKIHEDENIIRCHKSYIINRSMVQKVSGNARSLIITLKDLDFVIPVSRSFPREQLLSSR